MKSLISKLILYAQWWKQTSLNGLSDLVFCMQMLAEFKLGPEELERWFTKIDHVFEHTRVPQLGEALTPFYRVKADGVQRHHLPLISSINYKL